MSVTAGQVAVKLNLDKTQFEQGMQQARKSVDLLSTAFSSIAALGVGATLLNIGQNALKASSDFEQAQVAFGVMLGDAEKASRLVNQLQDMANVTPFETQDLLDASRVLLNFGIQLEDLLPDLQMLGDISGGNREKMRSMTLAFAQMSSAGRLMGQDMLQMVNAGFNPLQQISEETGKSMAVLKKEMEEGKISVDMVQQAFKNATAEGGRFHGMMEQQSQTLEGVTSTMSDAYTLMTRSISDMALPAIKEQIVETTKLIEKITEHINNLKAWVSVNQSTVYGLQNFAVALAATVTGSVALAKLIPQITIAYKTATAAIVAETAAQEALAYSKKVAAAEEIGLYQATMAYNTALATQNKELIKTAATNLQEAQTMHATAVATVEANTAKVASTRVTAAQCLMTGNLSKAIKLATVEVRAFTAALITNPITWITVALGAGAVAWWKYQQSIHETANAIEELNAKQDENVNKTTEAIRTIQELQGAKNLDYEQTKRLDQAIEYLTEKYPNYINKLKEELRLKGQISKATAEQIANEMTLAKVKDLSERKAKIDKKVERGIAAYNQQQLMAAARFGTPIQENPGRLGVSKSLQRDQDAINKELEKVKKEREAIVNELTSLQAEEPVARRSTSTAAGETKTAKQLAAEEKARQKEALDYKIAMLEVEKYETQKTEDEIYQINLQQANARINAAKAGTSEYAQALAQKLQLEREYEQKQKALKSQQVVDDLTNAKQGIDNQMAMLELEYDRRRISKAQLLQLEINFINQKKKLEEAALQEQLKLVQGNAAEEVKIKRASQQVMENYNLQANRKALELWNYQHQEIKGFADDFASEWGNTLSGLISGEMTFADAANSLFNNILGSFGDMCGEMVTRWIKDNMSLITTTRAFTTVKLWCDRLLHLSNAQTVASNTLVASSAATSAAATTGAATATAGAMTGLGSAVTFVVNPIMKLAGAMATLAASSGAVALSMPIIALSTAVTAASAALAALSMGILNTALMMTSPLAMMFAPVSVMLAAEMAVVGAAATTAAVAVGKLAVALAAASAAAIPFVGWMLAPAAAMATGAGIAAGQMLAASAVQFREKGGEVKKGQAYIVGEKRPELFIPDRNGRIEPNLNSLNGNGESTTQNSYSTTVVIQAIDTKDFKQRVGDLTEFIHGNIQKGVKKRQLAPLGG